MNTRYDRKRIFIFLAITYGIVIAVALEIFFFGGTNSDLAPVTLVATIFIYLMAYAPALANIATRLITREGWSNTYLRLNLRRGWPYYLAAFILPLMALILGWAIYYLLFPGRFDPSMAYAREIGKISATDTLASVLGTKAFHGLISVFIGAFLIFIGEEFGWRAYLLPKLMPLGPRKAVLLTDVIWSAYHWPLIIMGFNYGTGYWGAPVSALLLFTWIILPPSILYSWVTLRTGSVWPACIAHAVSNIFGTSLTTLFLIGKPDVLVGPSNEGIVGGLGYLLLALPVFLIPAALAPTAKVIPYKPAEARKSAEQAGLDAVS